MNAAARSARTAAAGGQQLQFLQVLVSQRHPLFFSFSMGHLLFAARR
jgi:hypothetical protein